MFAAPIAREVRLEAVWNLDELDESETSGVLRRRHQPLPTSLPSDFRGPGVDGSLARPLQLPLEHVGDGPLEANPPRR